MQSYKSLKLKKLPGWWKGFCLLLLLVWKMEEGEEIGFHRSRNPHECPLEDGKWGKINYPIEPPEMNVALPTPSY